MDVFFQQIINGITVGSIYALVALGYTMVYGILKLINFAHGELFTLGAYFALSLIVSAGLVNIIPNLVIGLLVLVVLIGGSVAVAGVVLERAAYKPLRNVGRLPPLVSALGASIFFQNAIMLLYGPNYKVMPENIVPAITWEIFGIQITLMRLIILLVSVSLMLGLYFLIQKTLLGSAIRASALDHDTARLMGINVDGIISMVFIIGPALGGIAGMMVGLYYRQISFMMGWSYGLKAFTAAILGGIGNIPGAMLGGLILGVVESLGAGYFSASWKDAIAFFILIVILIFRPTGLLGERVADKV
ncbi:branched-chain amino acid ABC transporter permease [Metallumcola ferriviriculae]|uniref:Branched-chain amino acid ABC transporter permease n=1 Tax=Metallumcola ferriviriculae TaxID=3039180 RepID=A0AAU0UM16_9FIRM|nr:branched-chain amino acid ABC transporter permease [Desulfitibacteraceae bacterium MK1]